ncbi:MAG: hypothetical protein H6720_29700 [Sandaracinus sp.]|nr:hypothetical protein [Sandaracinus sp.]
MPRSSPIRLVLSSLLLLSLACGGDDDGGSDDGGTTEGDGGGFDGSTVRPDGSTTTMDGGDPFDGGDGGGAVVLPDGNVVIPDAGPEECRPVSCAGRTYLCGDCIDNDGDGLVDSADPDCVGACDNNEAGYDLGIPGGDVGRCDRDCYYDSNQGIGNDGCAWGVNCDETLAMTQECRTPDSCTETQGAMCRNTCATITPNGCDCFGCCELPAGSGSFVFLGSNVDGVPTCTFADVGDPTKCFPCVPVGGVDGDNACYNECGRCELCLGRDPATIPADCFPPPPMDGGMPMDAGPLPDGSTPPDAGTPPPPPTCDDGRLACGVPGLAPCPANFYCLTGCCTEFF